MKDDDDLDAFTTLEALKTRLAVSDVGRMAVRGASREELLARYPDLRDQDIELAKRIASEMRDLSRDAEPEIDATRFRIHPALIPKARDWEFDRWVNDHSIPESFEYGKGWWDYVELIHRFAVRLESEDVRVIGHYIVDTPPPCERLPMPAVAITIPGVTFALRYDFGSWSLKHEEISEWVVSPR